VDSSFLFEGFAGQTGFADDTLTVFCLFLDRIESPLIEYSSLRRIIAKR
jgi:hypothetical protein